MRLLIIAALLLVAAPAEAHTIIQDPVKFVTSVYARMRGPHRNDYRAPEDIYTPRLDRLFALEKKEAGDEVGRMDFDFWSNAQDYELSDVKITGLPVEGAVGREIVIVKFKNTGKQEEIHFYFEKTPTGWLLDDVRSLKDETWTLSLILKYGWDG
ncbi:MAG TPA: hypothetical protein VK779_01975 [Rhizomicrobium sp.]|nr:hypothetical protein [Rhizomicrobium sp.]